MAWILHLDTPAAYTKGKSRAQWQRCEVQSSSPCFLFQQCLVLLLTHEFICSSCLCQDCWGRCYKGAVHTLCVYKRIHVLLRTLSELDALSMPFLMGDDKRHRYRCQASIVDAQWHMNLHMSVLADPAGTMGCSTNTLLSIHWFIWGVGDPLPSLALPRWQARKLIDGASSHKINYVAQV